MKLFCCILYIFFVYFILRKETAFKFFKECLIENIKNKLKENILNVIYFAENQIREF